MTAILMSVCRIFLELCGNNTPITRRENTVGTFARRAEKLVEAL